MHYTGFKCVHCTSRMRESVCVRERESERDEERDEQRERERQREERETLLGVALTREHTAK